MQSSGTRELGAISVGISEAVVELIVIVAVVFGLWKLAKLFWAALAN